MRFTRRTLKNHACGCLRQYTIKWIGWHNHLRSVRLSIGGYGNIPSTHIGWTTLPRIQYYRFTKRLCLRWFNVNLSFSLGGQCTKPPGSPPEPPQGETMIQPRIGQRVTVIDGSGPESGASGVVLSLLHDPYIGCSVPIKDDTGRIFRMFPCRLRAADGESIRPTEEST